MLPNECMKFPLISDFLPKKLHSQFLCQQRIQYIINNRNPFNCEYYGAAGSSSIIRNGGSQSPDRWLRELRNNHLRCQRTQTDLSVWVLLLYEHHLFMSNKANSFLKILCIITTSALATPNTNKTPVYYRFQQYTGTFLNRYLAVIGTYLLID